MKKSLGIAALFAATLVAGCSHPRPVYVVPPPPPPALDYQGIEQQGVHDGFDAARHDVSSGRPPVFDRHPRYRNPPVPPPGMEAYRQGFRSGYDQFLRQGAAPPPPPAY